VLTLEENELITRTGPGTPGGELLRRYWQPAALSEELPAGGAPLPVKLLGGISSSSETKRAVPVCSASIARTGAPTSPTGDWRMAGSAASTTGGSTMSPGDASSSRESPPAARSTSGSTTPPIRARKLAA